MKRIKLFSRKVLGVILSAIGLGAFFSGCNQGPWVCMYMAPEGEWDPPYIAMYGMPPGLTDEDDPSGEQTDGENSGENQTGEDESGSNQNNDYGIPEDM